MEIIGIIDYGSGNLHSVTKAFEAVANQIKKEIKVMRISDSKHVSMCDRIILPGVGTFNDCKIGIEEVDNLTFELEKKIIKEANPYLGICVGMQLLADKGFEGRETTGFGWISGHVEKIPIKKNIKIPHMGWNTVDFHKEHEILNNIQKDKREMIVYFVHSYQFELTSDTNLLGSCDYGSRITALIEKDNIIGCQFHPEKSQKAGLEFINNFINWYP